MKYIINGIFICTFFAVFLGCKSSKIDLEAIDLADDQATKETKMLYHRIKKIAEEGIAFGHQDATAYGIGWKHGDSPSKLKSDVKKVTGKFPAVFGFDVGHIELGKTNNLDTVSFALMQDHIYKIHEKGGIVTISWHLNNPVTAGGSWDVTPAISQILKGGGKRGKYKLWVKRLAQFLKSLKDDDGNPIPVVFRPYHEMNGGWFWWGTASSSPAEYKQLWRETLQLLQVNKVHNLLYVYAPNTLKSMEEFNLYYPGDEWVDILGVDIYNHGGDGKFTATLKKNLNILEQKANISGKPYALTESGNVSPGSNKNWWTEILYPGIKGSGISWALFWRNARPSHFFATYPGEVTEDDFKEFEALEETLFLKEIKALSH